MNILYRNVRVKYNLKRLYDMCLMTLVLDIHITVEVAGSIRWSINGRLVVARRVGRENDRMERVVQPAKIGEGLIDRQSIHRRPLFGRLSIFARYRMSFS